MYGEPGAFRPTPAPKWGTLGTRIERKKTMTVWGVRARRHGENESYAVDNNVAVIGWDDLDDLSEYHSREEIAKLMAATYSDVKPTTLPVWAGEVWAFKDRIKEKDLVVLPLKTRSALAVGKVSGPYKFESEWPYRLNPTTPRSRLGGSVNFRG
jgi:restriction system protein